MVLGSINLPSYSAESYANDENVERLWAEHAYAHAELHENILNSVDAKNLRLSPRDDEIFVTFQEDFPNFDVSVLNEAYIKSPEQKQMWRDFCEKFKNRVEDYSFATLLRKRCDDGYNEENTFLVPRVQFYAIEIARNRSGLNDTFRKKIRNV